MMAPISSVSSVWQRLAPIASSRTAISLSPREESGADGAGLERNCGGSANGGRIGAGRHAETAHEGAGHVALVGEAAGRRDLGQGTTPGDHPASHVHTPHAYLVQR